VTALNVAFGGSKAVHKCPTTLLHERQQMLLDPKLRNDMLELFVGFGLEHPEVGVFISRALNFHLAIENGDKGEYDTAYGVCDSLEQLRGTEVYASLVADLRPVTLILTPVRKCDEVANEWRWHKWGEYVGLQDPQCEYLYDEPLIELVYVFETVALTEETVFVDHVPAV
jgi:hypothetical protein